MALKTPVAAEPTPKAAPPVAASSPRTTVLELALYNLYTWKGDTYEKGKPYRFKDTDAMTLLSEQDLGRSVWRIYKPPPKKTQRSPEQEIVDATAVDATPPEEEMAFGRAVHNRPKGRLEIGDDTEIQDILDRPDESGDVTV